VGLMGSTPRGWSNPDFAFTALLLDLPLIRSLSRCLGGVSRLKGFAT
jgi:hypothetical protein